MIDDNDVVKFIDPKNDSDYEKAKPYTFEVILTWALQELYTDHRANFSP